MKEQELKIGNWIYRKYGNPRPDNPTIGFDFAQVTGVSEDNIWVRIKGGNILKYNKAIFDDLSPVPLNTEILEKAGFVKVEGKDSIYDKGQMRLYLGLHGSLCYTEYEKGNYCYLRLIKYAHELQNTHYILYGSELPLNL